MFAKNEKKKLFPVSLIDSEISQYFFCFSPLFCCFLFFLQSFVSLTFDCCFFFFYSFFFFFFPFPFICSKKRNYIPIYSVSLLHLTDGRKKTRRGKKKNNFRLLTFCTPIALRLSAIRSLCVWPRRRPHTLINHLKCKMRRLFLYLKCFCWYTKNYPLASHFEILFFIIKFRDKEK